MRSRGYSPQSLSGVHALRYAAEVVAAGVILLLVGFALVVPRGGVPGSASMRNVTLGMQRISTRGYAGEPSSRRSRIIQVVIGLAVAGAGIALIAASG